MKASELSTADLYRTGVGFMGVPWASSAKGSRAAILGVPFDCGTHAFRIGSRGGARSIREQSRLVRAFESERADYDIRAALKLVDCGDVDVTPSRIEVAFERIEEAAWRIASDGATVGGCGGGGAHLGAAVRAA